MRRGMNHSVEHLTFIEQGASDQVPLDYVPCRGVLVTRLNPGEYGVFLGGQWRRYKTVDWQSHFETPIHTIAGLETGWWGILPRLHTRISTISEALTVENLATGLACAEQQLNGIVKSKHLNVSRGLNLGLRPTVSM